jgi:hypothetical protein
MIYCTKCGTKNKDEATYCTKCGKSLTDTKIKDNSIEKPVDDSTNSIEKKGKATGEEFEETIEKFSKEAQDLGKRIEKAGKRFEKATDRASTYLDNWWDRSFGIFGPLLSSFIVLIILRIIIEFLRIGAEDIAFLGEVGDLLLDYFLLIFVLILVSSYCSYFSRKYKSFQWISPVIFAIVLVIVSLVAANIITVIGESIGNPDLANAEIIWREKYLAMIFVIALLIGYLIKVVSVTWENDHIK